MPRIVQQQDFNGVTAKVERLGLKSLIDELKAVVEGFQLEVREEKDSNGGAVIRRLIDVRFQALAGWVKTVSGDVDWVKCHAVNGTRVCVGVEVQMSARSDLLVMDVVHLRKAIEEGVVDVGVLVVPSDKLSYFLTDRAPSFSAAVRHVGHAKAQDLPLMILGIEHDGPGPSLPKQKKGVPN